MVGIGLESGAKNLLIVVEIDTVAVKNEVIDVGDADNIQLQTA